MKCNENFGANQITNVNQIRVFVGDNRKSKRKYNGHNWVLVPAGKEKVITDARSILFEDLLKHPGTLNESNGYDIAVLRAASDLFVDGDATAGPICLAVPNAIIDRGHTITTVGWGMQYEEFPKPVRNQPRNPRYTTCTTNKYGPRFDRFNRCDIQFLKGNSWKCKKIKSFPPQKKDLPSYENGDIAYDYKQCKNYFDQAKQLIARVRGESQIKWTRDIVTGGAENIIIKDSTDNNTNDIECYRKELFKRYGWCRVVNGTWGT